MEWVPKRSDVSHFEAENEPLSRSIRRVEGKGAKNVEPVRVLRIVCRKYSLANGRLCENEPLSSKVDKMSGTKGNQER